MKRQSFLINKLRFRNQAFLNTYRSTRFRPMLVANRVRRCLAIMQLVSGFVPSRLPSPTLITINFRHTESTFV